MNKRSQSYYMKWCEHGDCCRINLSAVTHLPAADGLGHHHPSVVLHEETQVVCAEEQEDCLQASQVKGDKHTPVGLKRTRERAVFNNTTTLT